MKAGFGSRLRTFRRSLGMTQETFAKTIYKSRGEIANLELERVVPSENVIELILNTYRKLNREWLVDGTGTMLLTHAEEDIADILIDGTEIQKAFLRAIAKRSDEELEQVLSLFQEISDELEKKKPD